MTERLADTYALVAMIEEVESYRPYREDPRLVTTRMNLLELAYILHRRHGLDPEELGAELAPLRRFVRTPAPAVIPRAAAIKAQLREAGKEVSYIDAWGYATARWLGIPFLTGDDDFEDVDHVEFVKA